MRGKKIVSGWSMKRTSVIIILGADAINSVFSNVFSFEMKKRCVESPKGEIGVNRLNCASSRTSGIVTNLGLAFFATMTSGNSDGFDLV